MYFPLLLQRKDTQGKQPELLAVYVCRGSVSRIENGERAVIDIEIDAIAKVLKTSPNALFEGESNEIKTGLAVFRQQVLFVFIYVSITEQHPR